MQKLFKPVSTSLGIDGLVISIHRHSSLRRVHRPQNTPNTKLDKHLVARRRHNLYRFLVDRPYRHDNCKRYRHHILETKILRRSRRQTLHTIRLFLGMAFFPRLPTPPKPFRHQPSRDITSTKKTPQTLRSRTIHAIRALHRSRYHPHPRPILLT